jgi:hypothetical protein
MTFKTFDSLSGTEGDCPSPVCLVLAVGTAVHTYFVLLTHLLDLSHDDFPESLRVQLDSAVHEPL